MKHFLLILLLFGIYDRGFSQDRHALNTGWFCKRADSVHAGGESLSLQSFTKENWMPATVPGTVLTTLLDNKKIPDPFFGMNNELIPDIYKTGSAYYTYWFIKDFNEPFPNRVNGSG